MFAFAQKRYSLPLLLLAALVFQLLRWIVQAVDQDLGWVFLVAGVVVIGVALLLPVAKAIDWVWRNFRSRKASP